MSSENNPKKVRKAILEKLQSSEQPSREDIEKLEATTRPFRERIDKISKIMQSNEKERNSCTHMHMELVSEDKSKPLYTFQSFFESPPGTHQWQCQRCSLIRNHNNDYEKRAEYFAKNPDECIKMNKKFQKLLKRGELLKK
jgi:hypothetical protein